MKRFILILQIILQITFSITQLDMIRCLKHTNLNNQLLRLLSINNPKNFKLFSSSIKQDSINNKKENHKYPRIYINNNNITINNLIKLDKDNSHYITNVIRLKNNFFIRIFNENCGEFLGKICIESSAKPREKIVSLEILKKLKDINDTNSIPCVF